MALKQPVSLLDLSLQAVGSLIANHACLVVKMNHSRSGNVSNVDNKNAELNIRECAQHYNTIIPRVMHNHVTYHTLKYMENRFLYPPENDVYSIVLRSNVTKFDLSDWPQKMQCMLYRNLSKLKYLKLLIGVSLKSRNLSYVLEGIKVMTQLEKFECYEDCSDKIVQVLCDNCPALVSLSVNGNSVTDSSVGHLLKLQNLQELNVSNTWISDVGLRQLLHRLPQLKAFKTSKYFLQVPIILTSLESVHTFYRSQEDVENITHFFPSVRNFVIKNSTSFDLSNVANLEYLTTLHISTTFFYKSNVNIILQKRGHQITVLRLSGMQDISLAMLLNEINTSCPILKYLYIYSGHYERDNVICSTDNQHVFQNLESVDVRDHYGESERSCVIYLLCASVNLKEVYFGHVKELCDQDIDRILLCNPLIHLQELYIKKHKLTVTSIYKLLSSCKELRYIGYEERWETINCLEKLELYNYIRNNNLNIKLVNSWLDSTKKKRVSVMKPEWTELPQSALFL